MKICKYVIIISIIFFSCKSKKTDDFLLSDKFKIKNNDEIYLDANHISENDFKSIYNSIKISDMSLIIDDEKISKDKMLSVFDTINFENYSTEINKKENQIIIKKR